MAILHVHFSIDMLYILPPFILRVYFHLCVKTYLNSSSISLPFGSFERSPLDDANILVNQCIVCVCVSHQHRPFLFSFLNFYPS